MNKKLEDFKLFARDHKVSSTTFDKYANIINNGGFNPMSIAKNLPTAMTPYIIEESAENMIQMDVFSRLMKERIIFLGTGIDSQIANIVNAQLLFLESVDSNKEIKMYINSPGGEVYSGLAMVDVMNFVTPEITTIVTGIAASMAFVIASNGTKGKRYALKHSRLMQHQPMGGTQGQATDMEIVVKEINKLKAELYTIISKNTGQDIKKIETDCDRDYWMTSAEAKDYGVIDKVIIRKK